MHGVECLIGNQLFKSKVKGILIESVFGYLELTLCRHYFKSHGQMVAVSVNVLIKYRQLKMTVYNTII